MRIPTGSRPAYQTKYFTRRGRIVISVGVVPKISPSGVSFSLLIPVVINMFRLADFLTGENDMYNGLKLL